MLPLTPRCRVGFIIREMMICLGKGQPSHYRDVCRFVGGTDTRRTICRRFILV